MAKDDKGHGSNGKGANYGKLSDAQLERRYKKLSEMKSPTDAHADALELTVDERERRRNNPAPPPGRGTLPSMTAEPVSSKKGTSRPDRAVRRSEGPKATDAKPSPHINKRGDTFKPRRKD